MDVTSSGEEEQPGQKWAMDRGDKGPGKVKQVGVERETDRLDDLIFGNLILAATSQREKRRQTVGATQTAWLPLPLFCVAKTPFWKQVVAGSCWLARTAT